MFVKSGFRAQSSAMIANPGPDFEIHPLYSRYAIGNHILITY